MHKHIYLPDEFLSHVEQAMPKHLDFAEFIDSCKRPLRKSIRINTLKISVDAFLVQADALNWSLEAIPWCDEGFWIDADETKTPLGNTAEHMAGLFYIQEASSMLPVSALFLSENNGALPSFDAILDTAAAPGSKTTQIAAKMNNQGILVANEYSASRVKILHSNIERCGVINSALSNYDGRVFGSWLPEHFDAVLLDAPCSGEGTIRKDPDALKNWSMESLHSISHTQKELIESAFQALKPGGVLVYSTCTLSKEENQQVCQHLLDTYTDSVEVLPLHHLFPNAEATATEEGFLHVFPQVYDSEGFFIAKFKKLLSVPSPEVDKKPRKFPFSRLSKKGTQLLEAALANELALTLPDGFQLWKREPEIWMLPQSIDPMLNEFRFSRMGIKIAETHKKGYKWQHQLVVSLAKGNEPSCIELDIDQAREWYQGKDIRPAQTPAQKKGFAITTYNGVVIGLGKWVSNRIKNGLPRDRVRDNNLF
ncbi:16S rRNA (cytosine(1407)-C(5))-methyltransferase RsmF [Vibrio sp.]|nr:16S rRNA (cytosine(1407)-C(5))-methyltransferase RsmF [Vibrio sp.]